MTTPTPTPSSLLTAWKTPRGPMVAFRYGVCDEDVADLRIIEVDGEQAVVNGKKAGMGAAGAVGVVVATEASVALTAAMTGPIGLALGGLALLFGRLSASHAIRCQEACQRITTRSLQRLHRDTLAVVTARITALQTTLVDDADPTEYMTLAEKVGQKTRLMAAYGVQKYIQAMDQERRAIDTAVSAVDLAGQLTGLREVSRTIRQLASELKTSVDRTPLTIAADHIRAQLIFRVDAIFDQYVGDIPVEDTHVGDLSLILEENAWPVSLDRFHVRRAAWATAEYLAAAQAIAETTVSCVDMHGKLTELEAAWPTDVSPEIPAIPSGDFCRVIQQRVDVGVKCLAVTLDSYDQLDTARGHHLRARRFATVAADIENLRVLCREAVGDRSTVSFAEADAVINAERLAGLNRLSE